MSTTESGQETTDQQVTTDSASDHTHSIASADRAVVVGKALTSTPTTNPENTVVEVLVDIAG